MRLIDADELLEWLEYWDKNLLDECAKDRIRQDTIEQMINQISFMPNLMWMPVSEGLPNDYDMVLVTINSGGKGCITYCQYEYDDVAERGVFKDANGIDIWISGEEVTAWMRLPEPWKGEEEC